MRAKRTRKPRRLRLESLEERRAPALVTKMLADLNTNTLDSIPPAGIPPAAFVAPANWIQYNGSIYFVANDQPPGFQDAGTELWKTDGTAAGTVKVKEIYPGFYGSNPSGLTLSNGTLFFSADDGTHGRELWKTDGISAGTVLVKDIDPDTTWPGSYPTSLTNVNGTVFFTAVDGTSGFDLWKSDGTDAGTVKVKHFQPPNDYPGGIASAPDQMTPVGGTLYFTGVGGSEGRALWKSDGTDAGTVLIADLDAGTMSSTIDNVTDVGGKLMFTTRVLVNNTYQYNLWTSNGTANGTTTIATFTPHFSSDYPQQFTVVNGKVYFTTDDGAHGVELWRSDGTAGGTVMVKDIWAGSGDSYPANLTAVGNTLFFTAFDDTTGQQSLWKSDGTVAGTVVVTNAFAGTASYPQKLTNLGGTLFFSHQSAAKDEELWKSDGTSAGTVKVTVVNPGMGTMTVANELAAGGRLYFSADDGTHGREVWRTDGTAAGTVMVKDVNTVTADSIYNAAFTPVNGTVLFAATDGTHGGELWKTDGTSGGTAMVKDINPGRGSALIGTSSANSSSSDIFTPVVRNGVLYFGADDGVSGRELWRSDGTATGTYMVKDIWSGPAGSNPRYLTVCNGVVYFSADDSVHGRELWKTDGTAAGTVLVKDVNPTSFSNPAELTAVGNTLFFIANDGTHGEELWKTDGTAAGTVMVKDISTGAGWGLSTYTAGLTDVGGTLFFITSNGSRLWRSDGTDVGTYMVKDIEASLLNVAVMDGILYFGGNGIDLPELWRSDGTAAGTYRVATNVELAGSESFYLKSMAVQNGMLLFQGFDTSAGYELWQTDGTSAGTSLLKDIMNPDPGLALGSMPALMTSFHGQIYLSADDWHHGRELWRTDGTTAGTVLFKNVNDFKLSDGSTDDLASYPGEPTNINGTLYFSAEDGVHGREVWTVTSVPPAATVGPVAPNPRNTPVDPVTISFNEPVTGFDLSDLSLTLNGTAVSLAGATLTTTDNTTFTLGNLGGTTTAEGTYVLRLKAAGSGIVDTDQMAIAADATALWVMDTTPPTVTAVGPVSPDPRNAPVASVDVTFSEPIDLTTFTAADVALARNGATVPLTGVTVSWVSGATYRVNGLAGLTGADGTYELTAAAAGITDLAANAGTGLVSMNWVMDTTPPGVASISAINPARRNTPVTSIDVTFTEPIDPASFTPAAIGLTCDGSPVALDGLSISALSASAYRVSGLGPFTAAEGAYAFTVDSTAVCDPAGNAGAGEASVGWNMDTTPPTVMIDRAADQPDPTNGAVRFTVAFSEPVVGFDAAGVNLSASTAGGSLTAAVGEIDPADYLVTVTGMASSGTVVAQIGGGAVTDAAGNTSLPSTSTDNTVLFDNLPPTATVQLAPNESDPTSTPSVQFDVAFSEPVVGFDATKVDLAGTIVSGAAASVTDSGDHTHFVVAISGMAAGGVIAVAVGAGAANDLAGNPSAGSNTATVMYIRAGTVQFSSSTYAIDDRGAPALAVTVTRANGSEGPLTVDYTTADGTAVAGTDYTATSGTLSWADGDTADKMIQIPIIDRMAATADTTFAVTLSHPTPAGVLRNQPSIIVSIHGEAGLTLDAASYATHEGDRVAVTLHRIGGAAGAVSVGYAAGGGTATAGADYAPTTGTLSWADGDVMDRTITIPIVADALNEGRETFGIVLSDPTGGAFLGPVTSATVTIAPSDGATVVGIAQAPRSTFLDADGDWVTVALGGKVGTLTYFLTDGTGPISEIDLGGTDPSRSTATITVRPQGGDGRVAIGEVDGAGLKSFAARAADLDGSIGAGFNLSGFLGTLTIGDVRNGADLNLAGTPPTSRSGAHIAAGVIGDGTAIDVAGPLASLRAIAVGKGSIDAPSVGTINVTGRKATKTRPAIAGDFRSDLTISGTGPVSGPALKVLKAAGAVAGSTITVGSGPGTRGDVGSVSVGSFVGSTLAAGYDAASGQFNLPSIIGSFRVTGAGGAFADSHVAADRFGTVALASAQTDNGGTACGFVFHSAVGRLTVRNPRLAYVAKAGGTQALAGDLEVEKV